MLLLLSTAFVHDKFAGRAIATQKHATSGEGDAATAAAKGLHPYEKGSIPSYLYFLSRTRKNMSDEILASCA